MAHQSTDETHAEQSGRELQSTPASSGPVRGRDEYDTAAGRGNSFGMVGRPSLDADATHRVAHRDRTVRTGRGEHGVEVFGQSGDRAVGRSAVASLIERDDPAAVVERPEAIGAQ